MQDAVWTLGFAGLSERAIQCDWVGNGMAKEIMFYIPDGFRREIVKWTSLDHPGKVIEFRVPEKKSA
jgi:hypothetical protein